MFFNEVDVFRFKYKIVYMSYYIDLGYVVIIKEEKYDSISYGICC